MYKLLQDGIVVFVGSKDDCFSRLPAGADGVGRDADGVVWAVVPTRSSFWGVVASDAGSIYLEGGEKAFDDTSMR